MSKNYQMNLGFEFDLKQFDEDGLRLFHCAMSGGGKSYGAKVFCEELFTAGYPLVILDPEGEYASLQELFPTIVIGGSYADVPLEEIIIEQTLRTVLESKKPIIVVYDLSLAMMDEQSRLAAIIQEKLFQLASKNRKAFFFIVEECQLIAPQKPEKGQTKSLNLAAQISKRGRKRGINTIWLTQRPSDVSKKIITQCNLWSFGKLIHDTDLNHLKDVLKAAKLTKVDVMKLKKRFYIFDGQSTNLVKFRKIKIKDLAKTPTLGETIAIEKSMDQSLDSIIKKLAQQAQESQAKKDAREDELVQLQKQVKKYQDSLQEKDKEIELMQQQIDVIRTIKVVSGDGTSNEELQSVLDERKTLKKELIALEKKLAALQKQYDVLADNIDQFNSFVKQKEKIKKKFNELTELMESFDLKETSVSEITSVSTEMDVGSSQVDDPLDFIRHPAIQKELEEVCNLPGISSRAVKGIFALLTQTDKVTYEDVRKSLGLADVSAISKAASRLTDRQILLKEKKPEGMVISLNIKNISKVIELQTKRAEGEKAMSEVFSFKTKK